ncbi:Nucleolysin TIAR [Hordeum vulgare]|nr:Nucleolysin TIAR [Hordeum vulgare]
MVSGVTAAWAQARVDQGRRDALERRNSGSERGDVQPPRRQAEIEAHAHVEAARAASDPVLNTKNDRLAYLVSATQRMENNIIELLLNQKSLERIVETKFHDLDNKVTKLMTMVNALKQEGDAVPMPSSDDDDSPTLPVTIQFRTRVRFAAMAAIKTRPSAPAAAPTMPSSAPLVSTPLAQRTFA